MFLLSEKKQFVFRILGLFICFFLENRPHNYKTNGIHSGLLFYVTDITVFAIPACKRYHEE